MSDATTIATAAREAKAALERLLDLLEWRAEPALGRAIDRLVQLSESER
jgi:hypothetical protein